MISEKKAKGKHFIVKAGNPNFSGVRLGVTFVNGEGATTSAEKAREFALNLGRTHTAKRMKSGEVLEVENGYTVICPTGFDPAKAGWIEAPNQVLDEVSPRWEREERIFDDEEEFAVKK